MTEFKRINKANSSFAQSKQRSVFTAVIAVLLAQLCTATFTGTIDMSDSEIGIEDVTYTFNLNF